MQYDIGIVETIETYVRSTPLGTTIYLDGADSREVVRLILEEGRVRLQERMGDQYVNITSNKPGKRANHILIAPTDEFVRVLENKNYQEELDQAVAGAVRGYTANESPVITAQPDSNWVPRSYGEQEPSWYNKYSERLRYRAGLMARRGNKEPQLHELPVLLEIGVILKTGGPYEWQNGIASVHSTKHKTYVITNPPTAEQLAEKLSQITGWRLRTGNNHR